MGCKIIKGFISVFMNKIFILIFFYDVDDYVYFFNIYYVFCCLVLKWNIDIL